LQNNIQLTSNIKFTSEHVVSNRRPSISSLLLIAKQANKLITKVITKVISK